MGYEITISIGGKVNKYNKEKLEELNKILTNEIEQEDSKEEKFRNKSFTGFYGGKIVIYENGVIDFDSKNLRGHFYDTDDMAEVLSEIIEDGYIKMTFLGEDGEQWGYFIKPNKVEFLEPILVPENLKRKIKEIIDKELGIKN